MSKLDASLESYVERIIDGRRKTREARFKPLPEGVETVDDVLREATNYLAEHLAGHGFKPALSKLSLTRRLGKLTHTITLVKGTANLSGVNVETSIKVAVTSDDFGRWCKEHGTGYARKFLWSSQLGNLANEKVYYSWQLVEREQRQAEFESMLAAVYQLALPALAAWSDETSIAQAVIQRHDAERVDWLMEAALWIGDRAAASLLARSYRASATRDAADFELELTRYRSGATDEPYRSTSGIAYLVVKHDLNLRD